MRAEPQGGVRLEIEDAEPTARDHGGNVAATEAEVTIGANRGIGHHLRLPAIRILRVFGDVVGEHRVVWREWRGDDFVDANAGAGHGLVKPAKKTRCIGHVRPIEQRGLFHRPPQLAESHKFSHVSHAPTEFLFSAGTTDGEEGDCDDDGQAQKSWARDGLLHWG
jgi:hypothetical protein